MSNFILLFLLSIGVQMATLEDLIRQKQELEKEIEEVTRRERINAINTCRELIQKFDLQPAEIGLKNLCAKAQ